MKRRSLLVLCFVLLGVSFAYSQQFRAALPSDFTNASPERFHKAKTVTVRSFTNPETFSCYAHVIKSEGGNILIDPGYYYGDLKDYVKSIGGVDTVLLSHNHVDHIVGLNDLMKDYPDAKIYIHELDRDGLYDININYSFERVVSEPFIIEAEALPLEAGEYTFSGVKVQVIPSPGHSPGSVLYYLPDEALLFLGDTIAFRNITRHDIANSNVPALFESMTRLKALDVPENTAVFFGHGEYISYGYMLKTFDCLNYPLVISVKTTDGDFTELEDFYLDGDTIMLPVSGSVVFLPDMTRLKVKAGSPEAWLDGFRIDMQHPAQLRDGKIYLPGKFLAQICRDFTTWKLTLRRQ